MTRISYAIWRVVAYVHTVPSMRHETFYPSTGGGGTHSPIRLTEKTHTPIIFGLCHKTWSHAMPLLPRLLRPLKL